MSCARVEPVVRAEVHQPVERVLLVAGEDGRVGREDDLVARGVERLVVARAGVPLLADQLEGGEEGVPLVEVVHVHVEPERAEGADAADPEHDLLRHAVLVAPAVEPVRDERGRVAGEVGVEEVERDVPERRRLPHLAAHVLVGDADGDLDAGVFEHVVGVGVRAEVRLRLPALVERLVAVALLPLQADADDGVAVVVRPFEVVTGEDAEAAGVGFQSEVETVLHAEVGDTLRARGHR